MFYRFNCVVILLMSILFANTLSAETNGRLTLLVIWEKEGGKQVEMGLIEEESLLVVPSTVCSTTLTLEQQAKELANQFNIHVVDALQAVINSYGPQSTGYLTVDPKSFYDYFQAQQRSHDSCSIL